MIDDSDLNEFSIYDIYRNKEEISFLGFSEDQFKCYIIEEIDFIEDCDRKDILVSFAMEDLCKDFFENVSRKFFRFFILVDNLERKNSIFVVKLFIKRLNFIELCRSVIMEYELIFLLRFRQRIVFDVFKELDSTVVKLEQILILEVCIRYWMVEIVIVIFKFYLEGIICRYTKSIM